MMMMEPDLIAAQVGVNYDPMIAKVIARGPDRSTALARLHTALSDLQVSSVLLLMCLLSCCLVLAAKADIVHKISLVLFWQQRLTSCTKVT